MRRDQGLLPMRRERGWELFPARDFGLSSTAFGSPWQMMRRMQEDMDRLFGHFFGGPASGSPAGFGAIPGPTIERWTPSVDISQTDREWCIEADLPGVKKDDIHVEVDNHHLVMRAEMRYEEGTPRREERAPERQYARRERRYGFFERVIPLPENVDEENIRCEFRDGVLVVHLPKMEPLRPQGRRIPVTEASAAPSAARPAAGTTAAPEAGNGKAGARPRRAGAGPKSGAAA